MIITLIITLIINGLLLWYIIEEHTEIKKKVEEKDFELLTLQRDLGRVNHKVMINVELINWLYNELESKNIKKGKEKKK